MSEETATIQSFKWSDTGDSAAYQDWRAHKLALAEQALTWAPIDIVAFPVLSDSERGAIVQRCRLANFAVYSCAAATGDSDATHQALRDFAAAFSLRIAEAHRSAAGTGIVTLKKTDEARKRGYIPYSDRAMNWHTDGYYNAPDDRIGAFVLHCFRPAATGGANELLDPEIAYIRLRDLDPRFVTALMHPEAMTIPENREDDGSLRPASVGPVFYPDPASGRLQMRYTARTRSIAWREDALTQDAQTALRGILEQGDPLTARIRLAAGQGILNNNVLHNRTAFEDGETPDTIRQVFRVRFHNRIGGS